MDATAAHPCRAQSLAWLVGVGVEVFEVVLTLVETGFETQQFSTRCDGRVTGLFGCAQFTSGIPFGGGEHIVRFAKLALFLFQFSKAVSAIVVIVTSNKRQTSYQEK